MRIVSPRFKPAPMTIKTGRASAGRTAEGRSCACSGRIAEGAIRPAWGTVPPLTLFWIGRYFSTHRSAAAIRLR